MRRSRNALRRHDAQSFRPRHAAVAIALLALLACTLGCAVVKPKAPEQTSPNVRDTDPFRPEQLRIHPLTRIIPSGQDEPPAIEIHIELLDRWGYAVKALGELRLELRFASDRPAVRRWNVDLREPQVNATERYDRVTRTYRLRLVDAPPELIGNSNATLHAAFRTLDGRTLTDDHRFDQ